MTTPERLRRRQYIEGGGLAALGVLVVLSTLFSDARDDKQDESFRSCIIEQVSGIGNTLDARGAINSRDTEATNRVILTVAGAGGDYAVIKKALDDFETDQAAIATERENTVIPPFPDGKCED